MIYIDEINSFGRVITSIIADLNSNLLDCGEVSLTHKELAATSKGIWDFDAVKLRFTPAFNEDITALNHVNPKYNGCIYLEISSYTAFEGVSVNIKITSEYACIIKKKIYTHSVGGKISFLPCATLLKAAMRDVSANFHEYNKRVLRITNSRKIEELMSSLGDVSVSEHADKTALATEKAKVTIDHESNDYTLQLEGVSFEDIKRVLLLLSRE